MRSAQAGRLRPNSQTPKRTWLCSMVHEDSHVSAIRNFDWPPLLRPGKANETARLLGRHFHYGGEFFSQSASPHLGSPAFQPAHRGMIGYATWTCYFNHTHWNA